MFVCWFLSLFWLRFRLRFRLWFHRIPAFLRGRRRGMTAHVAVSLSFGDNFGLLECAMLMGETIGGILAAESTHAPFLVPCYIFFSIRPASCTSASTGFTGPGSVEYYL